MYACKLFEPDRWHQPNNLLLIHGASGLGLLLPSLPGSRHPFYNYASQSTTSTLIEVSVDILSTFQPTPPECVSQMVNLLLSM